MSSARLVDVVPLVEAELDRRYPDRVKMRPTEADGFREAWDILDRLWQRTVGRLWWLTDPRRPAGSRGSPPGSPPTPLGGRAPSCRGSSRCSPSPRRRGC